jgi:CRP/FNR family cyclic AMP-dependent transcriptional regulator
VTPTEHIDTALGAAGRSATIAYGRDENIYTQGDPAQSVFYILEGSIRLSSPSSDGRDVTIAILGPGDFFGEGGMGDQLTRVGTATAISPSQVLAIDTVVMTGLLHARHELSDRFIASMLTRNAGLESDLIHELLQSN